MQYIFYNFAPLKKETIMIYTQQTRRALNKAVRSMFPDTEFYESPSGIPVMECYTLPEGAKQIMDADEFVSQVRKKAVRINDMGTPITDYGKTLPVFIDSMELKGEGSTRKESFYRVNYVSMSEYSLQKAMEYIAEGRLYAAIT